MSRGTVLACTIMVLATTSGAVDAKGGSACALVSAGEIRKWTGKEMTVDPIYLKIPQATACNWTAKGSDGAGFEITIAPARYYEPREHAKHYRTLAGIGNKAFVEDDLGPRAGALKGGKFVVVTMQGGTSSEATAIDALRTIVQRM